MFSLLAVVVGVLSLVAAQIQNCDRTYTVQAGDYCDSISAANNASTYQLAATNPSINSGCTNLMPGQVLCLGVQGQDCDQTYVVVAGDTCDAVADSFGLTDDELMQLNPNVDEDCFDLYIGEVLAVCKNSSLVPSGTVPVTGIPPTATPALPWCD